MKHLVLCALFCLAILSISSAAEHSTIRLKQIEDRYWLVSSEGVPFFAHGVTHVGGRHGSTTVQEIGRACKALGFNAYGYGCPPALKQDMPYLEGRNLVPMSHYRQSDGSFAYVDIFDPIEQAKLAQQVRQMCMANRKNPNLIGYCWTDLGAWPLENSTGTNWVEFIRELDEDAPGMLAYQSFLAEDQRGDPIERDTAFLRMIAREYFKVLGEANRRYDPDHLIFGDRFGFNTIVPEVIEEMLPWVDAIAIQPRFNAPFPKKDYELIHQLTNKPIIICDFAIRFKDGDKNVRGWKPEASAQAAGEVYADYIRQAFATDYILGAFWCNPIDSDPSFFKTGIKQGIFGQGLKPRPDLNAQLIELNKYLKANTPKLN